MNKTINYFKEISNIPRPSGKEEKIRDFLINFAKNHNLDYYTDKTFNVIIKKPSNILNCNKTLILQAHTDMVCEKNNNIDFDFNNSGIEIIQLEDFLHANGTTLGADNGIGLCMILSILDDNNLKIPNLECVFTSQEETTMQGAIDLNFDVLKGTHLLSIDGTDEGKIEVSSAGMVVTQLEKEFSLEKINNKNIFEITVTGLKGGHSGTEINTNRQNAIKILFNLLLNYKNDIQILSVNGGGKSNAIPRECSCKISINDNFNSLKQIAEEIIILNKVNENDISINIQSNNLTNCNNALSKKDSKDLIEFINKYKNGVLCYSKENSNFPITSCNLANISLMENNLKIIISLRSSVKKQEKDYLDKLFSMANKFNIKSSILSSAPFFERKENSYLQEICKKTYKNLFNLEAEVQGVHAGLEGGIFAGKKPELDICVIAPNIYDAHSPQEKVSISSINRVYNWLENIIESF